MAPQHAPTHRAQTIKQAKAAYKSRNQSTLTEREKKQIERSLELERRAWKAKEAEKRRVEAKGKREEKERKERDGGVGMTSQRRCDRFGFVGSQMHLGAFFGGRGGGSERREGDVGEAEAGEDDEFGGSLDDETMLDAEIERNGESLATEQKQTTERAPTIHAAISSRHGKPASYDHATLQRTTDLDLFWDELDTSTQIARDLATASPAKTDLHSVSPNDSFSSGEFDLSVEDIEEAQAEDRKQAKVEMDKKLMPPPALPIKISVPAKASTRPMSKMTSMPPPPRAVKPLAPPEPLPQPSRISPQTTSSKVSFAPYAGFTLAELESLVEDDIQLTQVDPV